MEIMALGLLGAGLVTLLSLAGRRLGVAPQIILVLAGVGLSFLPGAEALHLDPEIVLMGLLPLLLYASALALPAVEFRRDVLPIGALSVLLVLLSAGLIGWLLHRLVPGLPLWTGVALGALLSPTDAAATGVIKPLGLSPRLLAILNGESLLNDASALVLVRSALAAGAAAFSAWRAAGDFLYAAVVAFVIGTVIGRLGVWARSHVGDTAAATALSLLVPFLAYLPAEALGASGLMAVAAAGIATLQRGPHCLRAVQRMTERANWHTIEFLVEGVVFLLMGLQLHSLAADLMASTDGIGRSLALAGLALVGTMVIRAVFLSGVLGLVARGPRRKTAWRDEVRERASALLQRWPEVITEAAGEASDQADSSSRRLRPQTRARAREYARANPEAMARRFESLRTRVRRYVADVEYLNREPLRAKEGGLLTWAGMRGVVTVAGAQTLPLDLEHRPLLVAIAFAVAFGSLVLQGGTLPWVVRRLGLTGRDGAPEGEADRLQAELFEAAIARLDQAELRQPDGAPYDARVLQRARRRLGSASPDEASAEADLSRSEAGRQFATLWLICIEAMRERLLEAQAIGSYASASLGAALDQLDADEISTRLRAGLAGEEH